MVQILTVNRNKMVQILTVSRNKMVQILTVNRRSHHPIEILVFFADNIGGFLKASSVLQPGAIFIYRNTYF